MSTAPPLADPVKPLTCGYGYDCKTTLRALNITVKTVRPHQETVSYSIDETHRQFAHEDVVRANELFGVLVGQSHVPEIENAKEGLDLGTARWPGGCT